MTLRLEELLGELAAEAASTFRGSTNFDDLVQFGRLKLVEIAGDRTVTAANFPRHKAALWSALTHAMIREIRDPLGARAAASGRIAEPNDYSRSLDVHLKKHYGADLEALAKRHGEDGLLKRMARDSLRQRQSAEHKRAVIWALVRLIGLELPAVPKRINYQTFIRHGLGGWLWGFFNNSPFRALNFAYPGKFLAHHMKQSPMRYWSGRGGRDRAASVLRTALESTGYDPRHYPKLMTTAFLREFKLTAPLWTLFGSCHAYLDAAYPGRYRPWELAVTPAGFFDRKANVIAAVRWMVEERMQIPMSHLDRSAVWDRNIARLITKEAFSEHGLRAVIARYVTPQRVLRMVYPNKWFPWSFDEKQKWSGPKGRRLAAAATRWLIEDHLGIKPISTKITNETFRQNGFSGMMTSRKLGFNCSTAAILKNAYPHLATEIDDAEAAKAAEVAANSRSFLGTNSKRGEPRSKTRRLIHRIPASAAA